MELFMLIKFTFYYSVAAWCGLGYSYFMCASKNRRHVYNLSAVFFLHDGDDSNSQTNDNVVDFLSA